MTREEELLQKENELNKQMEEIRKEKELIYEQKIKKERKLAENKIEYLRENRDLILGLIDHDRTSCSDDNTCNGYGSASYGARCRKCHLIEILDGEWGDSFDVNFGVEIRKIE